MKVPIIPRKLFRFGISPKTKGIELPYPESHTGLHLCGFDVETVGKGLFRKNDLYTVQIVADSPENSHIFFPENQGVENLWMFFEAAGESAKSIYATAHNASFDIGALLGKDAYEFMRGRSLGGWEGKIVDGNACFLTLKHKSGKKLTISDSMAWFPGSLKNVASAYFGEDLQKYARPEYLGKRTPQTQEELNGFTAYAEQDAIIQFHLTRLIYAHCTEGNVPMSLTPAQLAGKVFLKHYLTDRIFLPNWKLLDFIAKTYHGAEFTAFGRGFFEKIFYYDINSLYPDAAIKVPLNFSNTELKKITLEDIEHGACGFVGCKFEFDEDEMYPCLPQYRTLEDAPKMVFPRRGISYCTTEELKLALEKGCNIHKIMAYGWQPEEIDIKHPLGDYMKDIYSKKNSLDNIKKERELSRAEGNKRQYYKLLLNSLIGKFCQRNSIWLENREVAGQLFKPDFGSLILSKSRAMINQLISRHGAVYSDTDCLMTRHSLPTGTGMGELKNELGGNKAGSLLSIRSKLYFITDGTDACSLVKCAKHGFRQPGLVVYEEMLKNRDRESIKYSLTRLIKLKESYKRHCLPRREISQTFCISLRDDGKRIYNEQLNTVRELMDGNSFSQPLQSWNFELQP